MQSENEYLDYAVEQIANLCGIPSPTGFTEKVQQYLVKELERIGYKPEVTHKGSVLAELGGEGNALALAAHGRYTRSDGAGGEGEWKTAADKDRRIS